MAVYMIFKYSKRFPFAPLFSNMTSDVSFHQKNIWEVLMKNEDPMGTFGTPLGPRQFSNIIK